MDSSSQKVETGPTAESVFCLFVVVLLLALAKTAALKKKVGAFIKKKEKKLHFLQNARLGVNAAISLKPATTSKRFIFLT